MEVAVAARDRIAWQGARRAALALLGAALLGGCAALVPQSEALREAPPVGLPERTELAAVPFFPQQDYQCGPAALATVLVDAGVSVTEVELVDQVYLPARKGSLQVEMLAAARRYGMVSYRLAPRFEDLLREVAAGTPVVVLQNYGLGPFPIWHYAVVAGYDQTRRELMLRSGEKQRLVIPYGVFEYTWKRDGYWAMVAVPPERIPATAREPDYLAAVAAMERVAAPEATARAYESFLARWPGNAVAALGLANSQYAQGQLVAAEATLRRAAERDPQAVAVLNNLAHVVSEAGRHAEALALIERAHALGGPLAGTVAETRESILARLAAKPSRTRNSP